jgi:hypothetical protein
VRKLSKRRRPEFYSSEFRLVNVFRKAALYDQFSLHCSVPGLRGPYVILRLGGSDSFCELLLLVSGPKVRQ